MGGITEAEAAQADIAGGVAVDFSLVVEVDRVPCLVVVDMDLAFYPSGVIFHVG